MARKLLTLLFVTLAIGASACGSSESTESTAPAGSAPAAGSEPDPCATENLQTLSPGTLTIGTDNPTYTPYFAGGAGHEWKGEFNNDPYTGEGFENAVAYAVAERMGFTKDQVTWAALFWKESFKPGPKNFDFYLAQVSITPKRQEVADFSVPYYTSSQGIIGKAGSPVAEASSLADLKDVQLGVESGTTSLDAIDQAIAPSKEPMVYDSTKDAVRALENGQIDGLVTDFPSAYYIAFVDPGGYEVLGQFSGTGGEDQWGLVLDKDSPLTPCVDQALQSLEDDGTLAQIEKQWLSDVVQAPILE